MRTSQRLIPGFVAAVLVLAACGSDDDSAADLTVPDAGSSTTDSSDTVDSADDGLVAPRPIEVTGAGGSASGSEEMAPAADQATSDGRFAPYQITTFVAGEGLGELPQNQIGFVFEAGANPVNVDQIDTLAAALGVTGDAERHDDGYSAWWTVGPDDGTAPSLTLYEDAQLSWYYSPAWAEASATSVGCAVAGSTGVAEPASDAAEPAVEPSVPVTMMTATTAPAPDMPVCETPEPPPGILTAEEAEARTRELMTSLGLDPSRFTFEPYADEWFASVTATEQLEGGFGGRRFDAGFGAEGVLQNAGGQLATPAQAGPYELVDLETAIARLNDQSGFWGGFGGGIAVDTGVATGAVAPDVAEAPVSDVMPADLPVETLPGETLPGESVPPAEPVEVTVTLVDVEADVWWVWDADGSVWLLPAYRFIGDDGGWYTVPAVADELLVQAPLPETTIEPVPPSVDTKPEEPAFDATQLESAIGSTLAEFEERAEALGASVRVAEQDGVSLALTMDYSSTRVNVAVEGDTVTRIIDVG